VGALGFWRLETEIVLSDVKQIEVFKSFVLTLVDGTTRKFQTGIHEVEESIAAHWYTLLHSRVVPEVEKAVENAEATVVTTVEETEAAVKAVVDKAKKKSAKKAAQK
jgi:hypothetical protein